jgi:hypothetical protein
LATLPQDEHGQFGQPVAGEEIDGPTLDHLCGRGQTIAVEPRTVGDAQRCGHDSESSITIVTIITTSTCPVST